MEEKLNGIVLGGVNYGENDRIINVFTVEKGTVSAMLKGVKKKNAKLKFAQEPFCFAEFIFAEKSGRRTVMGATLIDTFYPIREDIVKLFCASTVLEFIKRFVKESIISSELFLLTIDTLKKMSYSNIVTRSILTEFLLKALKYTGYGLNLHGCFKCGCLPEDIIFFDCFSGGFLCGECADSSARQINLSTFENLRRVEAGETLTDAEAVKTLRLLEFYLINKTEEDLNSFKELLKIPVAED